MTMAIKESVLSDLVCSDLHVKYINTYCENCKIYLCYQCKPLHLGHSLKDIPNIKKSYNDECDKFLSKINTLIEEQKVSLDNVAVELADLITIQIKRTYHKIMKEIEENMHKRVLKLLGDKTVHGFVAHKAQQQKTHIEKLKKIRDELKEIIGRVNHPENTIERLIVTLSSENLSKLNDEYTNMQSILKYTINNRQAQIRAIKLEALYNPIHLEKMLNINEPLLKTLGEIIEEELAARKNKIIHLKLTSEFCLIDPYSHKIVTRSLKPNHEFPYSFDYIEMDNRVFISGGETIDKLVLKATHELDEQQGILLKKAGMSIEKKWHTLCELTKDSFYCVGGCNTFGTLAVTEKYSVERNEWKLRPMLNEVKYFVGAVGINGRYVYTFGGYDGESDLKTIEKLDEQDMESGLQIINPINENMMWSSRRNIGCYSISDKEILVFGGWDGNWRSETFIFHTVNQTFLYTTPMVRGEKFYRSKPKKIESTIYIIGYYYGDLHSYNLINKGWNMKTKEQWAPKL